MVSLLGRSLLLLALGACAVGATAGFVAGFRKRADALRLARWMAFSFGGSMLLATLLMEYALLTHDFSVSYVAKVGSTATPTWVTIVSLWSSLEGSILLWGLVLGASAAIFAWNVRDRDPEHAAWALGTLMAIGAFFAFMVAGIANPFEPMVPVPADGPGPNALLQNHALMIIHPPSLYMGYVTMAVPFAMSASALLAGRLEAAWMRLLRRWTLWGWAWLTLGILLGGWWSYEVLGWGGYWAWDPVENASFMPWLTATAFLHMAMVTERRGQFKGWTVTLGMATFLLTMLGTFMTRSGVFNSVHSFTQSPIGPVFLGFIGVCLAFTVGLLALRMHALKPPKEGIAGPVSREVAFLVNNLLLVAFTFTVLLGTLYPLLKEAFDGERLSVGEPYFNRMSLPICVALLFLMGVGPALPWGESDPMRAAKRLIPAAVVAALAAVIALGLGVREPWPLSTFVLCGFAGTVTLRELLEPARLRAASKGESIGKAFMAYAVRSRPRVAAYTVHFGVVVCAFAIAASGAYKEQVDVSLPSGEPVEVLGYELTYLGTERVDEAHRVSFLANVRVRRGGSDLGVLSPRMNHYATMAQPIGTPAVKSRITEDLYLSLVNTDSGQASVRVIVEPFVYWLWIGGLVMSIGGVFGFWPTGRRRKAEAEAVAAK